MNIKKALAQERKLRETLAAVKDDIYQQLCKAPPLPGVSQPLNSPAKCCIITLGAIRDQGLTLDPAYYNTWQQADAVRRRLEGAETVSSLCERMADMVAERKIVISKDVCRLNPNTVKILSEYLGNSADTNVC